MVDGVSFLRAVEADDREAPILLDGEALVAALIHVSLHVGMALRSDRSLPDAALCSYSDTH